MSAETAMQRRRTASLRAVTHAYLDVLINPKLSRDEREAMYVKLDESRDNQQGAS
jgi:hypothetical protein